MSDKNNPTIHEEKKQLDFVGKYGFAFFGFDENGKILVKAPNQQIVPVGLAYRFIQEQILNNSTSSNGPEDMPEVPNMPDSNKERKVENKDVSIEQPKDSKSEQSKQENSNQASSPQSTAQNSPQINIKQSISIPYQSGFDPKSFDPSSVDSTLEFIKKHSKSPNNSSDKWLAVLFDKFLNELQEGSI